RSVIFFFSSRRRHTRFSRDWSSDVCSSDLRYVLGVFVDFWWVGMFPISTLIANLSGAFLLTWFTEGMRHKQFLSKELSIAFTTRSEERRVGKECRCRS